jgi:hypothetical protein
MEAVENGKRVVSINHNFGMNFSLLLKAFIEVSISLFKDKNPKCGEIKVFDNCVVFNMLTD